MRKFLDSTLVGGVRSLAIAQKTIDDQNADLVGICRPLIREPDLVARWRKDPSYASTCVSCSRCLATSRSTAGVHCPIKL